MASPRPTRLARLAPTLSALLLLTACSGVGYQIQGERLQQEPPLIADATSPLALQSRASLPPGLHVEMLCAAGPMVRSGFSYPELLPPPSPRPGIWMLSGAPLSASRSGFSVPLRAEGADALPLVGGTLFELRAVGRAPVFGGRLPNRLQVCRWRPDSSLLGLLWRPEGSAPDEPYELRPTIPPGGLRATGVITVHEEESATGWWRVHFKAENGRVFRIRYAPVLGKQLPLQGKRKLVLQVLPADPVATLSGLAVIFQEPDGTLIAAINGGASLSSELLGGVEIAPSGRLMYSEVKQLPSLCVSRLEHQSLRVRASQGVSYVPPGTHLPLTHRGKVYRLVAHDAVVKALEDPCGREARQHLSYVLSLEGNAD